MANFSLEDVKALRERLGTGMVDTKNALVEADGDIEKAVEILRLKGAKGNAKRADRSTSEGLIAVVESATAVTMIELACETDFVAKNDKFVALAEKVVAALADSGAETVDAALAVAVDGGTVGSLIEDQAATIGEKVELRQVVDELRLLELKVVAHDVILVEMLPLTYKKPELLQNSSFFAVFCMFEIYLIESRIQKNRSRF